MPGRDLTALLFLLASRRSGTIDVVAMISTTDQRIKRTWNEKRDAELEIQRQLVLAQQLARSVQRAE